MEVLRGCTGSNKLADRGLGNKEAPEGKGNVSIDELGNCVTAAMEGQVETPGGHQN